MLDTVTRKFNYIISTDGYAVSLSMQKPKPPGLADEEDQDDGAADESAEYDSPAGLQKDDFDCFLGVDPGQTYVATVYGGHQHQNPQDLNKFRSEYVQVSTREVRHDSKMTESKLWRNRHRENHPAYAEAINAMMTLKTADFEVLKANIRTNFIVSRPLVEQSLRTVFRAKRFKSYRFGQMTIIKSIKKLIGPNTDPKKTVIGWGAWDRQGGGALRGNDFAPVKKLRRACREYGIKVVKVNEFLTSKRCSACRSPEHKCQNVEYNGISCHQVIRCTNSECEMIWQRDLNAARNIHEVLMTLMNGQARPVQLRWRGYQL
jgi:transposase